MFVALIVDNPPIYPWMWPMDDERQKGDEWMKIEGKKKAQKVAFLSVFSFFSLYRAMCITLFLFCSFVLSFSRYTSFVMSSSSSSEKPSPAGSGLTGAVEVV